MNMKKVTWILVLILVAVVSFTKVSDWATNPTNHQRSIEQTDKNISTVMKLSAGSAAASVALTLLPGDIGTPVADQLADMSKYFLIILSALYLEKYLITLTGYISFSVLVPAICILLIAYICTRKQFLLKLAGKVVVCALAISIVIPVSVKISDIIYKTQETAISTTIEEMDNFEVSADEDSGFLNKVTSTASNAVDRASDLFTDLLEALAIMLITSCVIPILVFVFLVWLIKMVFNN